MTFNQAIQNVLGRNYANFGGRASRSEYWYFVLFLLAVNFIFAFLGLISGGSYGQTNSTSFWFSSASPLWVQILSGLFSLAMLIPSLAVSVRRMHDIGKGGGWIFITLIPLIGQIWFLILTLQPSEPEANRFGPVPDRPDFYNDPNMKY